jgi:aminopeptidase N
LRKAIGVGLSALLLNNYGRLAPAGPYQADAVSAGRRALRNTCLDLLAATGRADFIALASRQYDMADNMTDRIAALSALAWHDVPERAAAVADFYARYRNDPLIIDKWFTLQASIPEPATLDRVRALTSHPAFSLANPNRVRALIHSFALNQKEFNRPDGAGYDFIADMVLTIDPKNPQVAARLLSAFRNWRVLEPARQALAQTALQRVSGAPSLSRDVADIVERTLAAQS